ncbi:hypothetical protein KM043_010508 [Ampulex compressa]|nr:hypothetical protein KM043_010508 [Ampulex compressa]
MQPSAEHRRPKSSADTRTEEDARERRKADPLGGANDARTKGGTRGNRRETRIEPLCRENLIGRVASGEERHRGEEGRGQSGQGGKEGASLGTPRHRRSRARERKPSMAARRELSSSSLPLLELAGEIENAPSASLSARGLVLVSSSSSSSALVRGVARRRRIRGGGEGRWPARRAGKRGGGAKHEGNEAA